MPQPELDPTIRIRLIDGGCRNALAAAPNQRRPHGHENCELAQVQLTERLPRQPAWLLVSRILREQAQGMLAQLARGAGLMNELIGRVADKWTMIILEVLAEHGQLRFTSSPSLWRASARRC